MKTAMQELIEELESIKVFKYKNLVIRLVKNKLEKEKEQIVNAFEQGIEFAFPTNGSYYYNQTYKQTNAIEVDTTNSSVTTTGIWTPKTN